MRKPAALTSALAVLLAAVVGARTVPSGGIPHRGLPPRGFRPPAAPPSGPPPQSVPPAPAPPRDVRPAPQTGTSIIRGRVVAADSGRPISLATITASAPELRESRSISTNSDGRYELRNLPAGRYSLSVSRSGFLTLQYGQRRPLDRKSTR